MLLDGLLQMSILGLVTFSLIRLHVEWEVAGFQGHSMLYGVVDVKTCLLYTSPSPRDA